MTNLMALLRTPQQAATIYSQSGQFPKQRHTFLVRFNPTTGQSLSAMTFVVKSADRPSVQPHSEELNQYNRKRHIYTGYKIAPMKMVFYDDEASSALSMWANYLSYYYGDFNQSSPEAFNGADIVGGSLNDPNNNYGFTATNGNQPGANSQFFFKTIQLFHVHGTTFDLYTMINPRIVAFDPDDLDYEQSAVATISAQFAYEALFINPAAGAASSLTELQSGQPFDAGQIEVPGVNPSATTPSYVTDASQAASSALGVVQSLFGSFGGQSSPSLPDWRYYSSANGGGLGIFGNYGFGQVGSGSLASTLSAAALGNPALAAALALGGNTNPLASATSLANGVPINPGIPGPLYAQAAMLANAATGGQGNSAFGQNLTSGILSSALLGAATGGQAGLTAGFAAGGGVVLSPAAYSLMNAQGSGAAQVGFNPNTTPAGTDFGYQGPAGIGVPILQTPLAPPAAPTDPSQAAAVAAQQAATQAAAAAVSTSSGYVPPPNAPSSTDQSLAPTTAAIGPSTVNDAVVVEGDASA